MQTTLQPMALNPAQRRLLIGLRVFLAVLSVLALCDFLTSLG
jgi:hypothetical protein